MRAATLLTGFLGAGKSTLLQQLVPVLRRLEHGRDVHVLNNELAAASVPEGPEGGTIYEGGGCVCCDLRDTLLDRLRDLPGLVVLETTGLALPQPIAQLLEDDASKMTDGPKLRLDCVITVVDAVLVPQQLRQTTRDEVCAQLALADAVLVSKVDLVDPAKALDLIAPLHATRAFAMVRGEPVGAQLEEVLAEARRHRPPPGQVPAQAHRLWRDGLCAGVLVGPYPLRRFAAELERDALEEWLRGLLRCPPGDGAAVFRLKGVVSLAGSENRHVVQGFGEMLEITEWDGWGGEHRLNKLVLIGQRLDLQAVQAQFKELLAEQAPQAIFTLTRQGQD